MKLLQDTTQNIPASPLLTTAAGQGREGLSNQSKQGFADSLRHQISLVTEPARLSAKAARQESGRQSGPEQHSKTRRGTELPVREQKLPRNNQTPRNDQTKPGTETESAKTHGAKRNKQSADESTPARSGQLESADNIPVQLDDHNDIVLLYPPIDDTLPAVNDLESGVAKEQFFAELSALDISGTGVADDVLLPEVLNATAPSPVSNVVTGYEPHLPQWGTFATNPMAATAAAQESEISAVPSADDIATITQPGIISPDLATANTELQLAPETRLNIAPLQPEQTNIALDKSAVAPEAVAGDVTGRTPAAVIPELHVGPQVGDAEALLHTPSHPVAPAAATADMLMQQNGSRQNTSTTAAGLTQSVLQQSGLQTQTNAADAPEMFDVSLTADYASEETPDAGVVFSEKLLNQKPALSGSAQYASMLAQSASSSTAYADTPITNGLLSMLVSGQQSSTASLEASALTATQAGITGSPSSNNSASGLAASLYTLDQRQQAAAEARLAHTQNTRGVDTSMAATSALKLPGLDVAFGQAGWADRLGRMMLLQSAQGSSSAQIRLDPPELGSLTVRIQLADQAAAVSFVSPHAMVRDALEQQSARLQEMFSEQGLDLVDVSVSDQSTQSGNGEHRESDGTGSGSSMLAVDDTQTSGAAVKKSESLIDFYA